MWTFTWCNATVGEEVALISSPVVSDGFGAFDSNYRYFYTSVSLDCLDKPESTQFVSFYQPNVSLSQRTVVTSVVKLNNRLQNNTLPKQSR
jgi:hypothetical protein